MGGSTALAIAITVASAAGNNVGKVLQKQATRSLPKLALKADVLGQYLRNRTWLLGVGLDVVGGAAIVLALLMAPVSLVQPVSGIGLPILLVFSHYYTAERLQPHEWAATGLTGAGILLLGVGSDNSAASAAERAAAAASPARTLLAFLVMQGALAAEIYYRHGRSGSGGAKAGGAAPKAAPAGGGGAAAAAPGGAAMPLHFDALVCGLEAGACFGFSGASCRCAPPARRRGACAHCNARISAAAAAARHAAARQPAPPPQTPRVITGRASCWPPSWAR